MMAPNGAYFATGAPFTKLAAVDEPNMPSKHEGQNGSFRNPGDVGGGQPPRQATPSK